MALDLVAELEALVEVFDREGIECGLAGRPQDLADLAKLEGSDDDDEG